MSTLRVSNIEAKADASSPTIDEKVKVTNSQGRVLVQIDGKTVGITTVGINTTGNTFTVDPNGNIQFVGVITAANVNTTGVSTFSRLNVGTGGTVITTTATGFIGLGTNNPLNKTHIGVSDPTSLGTSSDGIRISDGTRNIQLSRTGSSYSYGGITGTGSLIYSYDTLSLQADTSNPIIFSTGANERARIDSSGNLKLSAAGTKVLNSSGNPILQQTGSILQVIWKDLGSSSFTATSTSSTYRATGFTNTITPSASTSKILHTVTIGCQFICDGNIAIARGGTVVSPSLMDSYRDGITASYTVDMPAYTFTWLDSPATTSAISYELYCRAQGCSGTMFVGSSGDFTSSWTLMEVAA
jgi:hypothetical protein